jgi:hypothetical protein
MSRSIFAIFLCFLFINASEIAEEGNLRCPGFEYRNRRVDNHTSVDDTHILYVTVPLILGQCSPKHVEIWQKTLVSFSEEDNLFINLRASTEQHSFSVIHYAPVPVDRTCLVKPPYPLERIRSVFTDNYADHAAVVEFINVQTGSYRNLNGSISGFKSYLNELLKDQHRTKISSSNDSESSSKCDRISFESLQQNPLHFIQQYWLKQRPVIVEQFPSIYHGRKGERCSESNDDDYSDVGVDDHGVLDALSAFLDDRVGTKLSPSDNFEGIDNLEEWGMAVTQRVPPEVHI